MNAFMTTWPQVKQHDMLTLRAAIEACRTAVVAAGGTLDVTVTVIASDGTAATIADDMPDTGANERGTYARFALATPNDGDQTVEVFKVTASNGDGYLDTLAAGYYWQNLPEMGPCDRFDSELAALNDARAFYGYGPNVLADD